MMQLQSLHSQSTQYTLPITIFYIALQSAEHIFDSTPSFRRRHFRRANTVSFCIESIWNPEIFIHYSKVFIEQMKNKMLT